MTIPTPTYLSYKMSVSVCALVLLISLNACAIVKVDGFEHEKTNRILNTFYWNNEKATLKELFTDDMEEPVLVPNFRGILSAKLSKTQLRIITREETPLVIEQAIVRSLETNRSSIQRIDVVTKPFERVPGIWVATVDIALGSKNEVFKNTQEVRLSIAWRYSDSSEVRNTEFVLLRKQRRDVAWVT